MWSSTSLLALACLSIVPYTNAQTSTKCNPLSQTCAADPALGKSVDITFTSSSSQFTEVGTVTYDSNGAAFTVAKSGDSPQLNSNWYIMFGKVTYTIKAAPGQGMVSSAVLQSDDLDEIDWEFVGSQSSSGQTNYFGKGITGSYNRGGNSVLSSGTTTSGYHTYTVDWTAEQIVWQIDGTTVRVLTAADAETNQYPQTPMQIRVGAWAGGDPSNSAGTIAWAGGAINYADGPYTMYMKEISVQDYSTGTEYTYDGTTGTWESIKSTGGTVNGDATGSSDTSSSGSTSTSTSSSTGSVPAQACSGWKACDSSTTASQSGYPWSASTTLATLASPTATISGLPSGWTSSSQPSPASSAYSPSLVQSSAGPLETVTRYNQQGFPTVVCVNPSDPTYDGSGNLVTQACADGGAASTPTATAATGTQTASAGTLVTAAAQAASTTSSTPLVYAQTMSGNAAPTHGPNFGGSAAMAGLVGAMGMVGMALI